MAVLLRVGLNCFGAFIQIVSAAIFFALVSCLHPAIQIHDTVIIASAIVVFMLPGTPFYVVMQCGSWHWFGEKIALTI